MSDKKVDATNEPDGSLGIWQWLEMEFSASPVNIFLVLAIIYMLYKIFKSDKDPTPIVPAEPAMPRMKKRDFTLSELKKFDGTQDDGRILIAVLGKVYDVTKGKRHYGPGGPYSAFAGHDASRGLATFNVSSVSEDYDDLSDLTTGEIGEVREWELQMSEKYDCVGKLLKPGEEPTFYSDASSDDEDDGGADKKKD